MKTHCYWNLTRKVWALAPKPDATPRYMPDGCLLEGVTFKVSEARWKWCNAHPMPNGKPRRKVHAYAIGEMVTAARALGDLKRTRIDYDISGGPYFIRCDTGARIDSAEYVLFTPKDGAFAIGEVK
jgi:hypothetical protein